MTIQSVGDYLNIINQLNPNAEDAFFRGQRNNTYKVSSSLYRYLDDKGEIPINKIIDFFEHNTYEFTMLLFRDFLANFPLYADIHKLKEYSPNSLDLLISAQHHELKTRLIDFSKSPLVALYFAAERVKKDTQFFSVFMIKNTKKNIIVSNNTSDFSTQVSQIQNAYKDWYRASGKEATSYPAQECITSTYREIFEKNFLSEKILSKKLQPMINANYESASMLVDDIVYGRLVHPEEIVTKLIKYYKNFCRDISCVDFYNEANINFIINPLPISDRLKNQQGVLLFSKKIGEPLYESSDFDKSNLISKKDDLDTIDMEKGFYRIDIDCQYAEKILSELASYGIKEEFIYPEITRFTKNLPDKIYREVKGIQ